MKQFETRLRKIEELLNPSTALFHVFVRESNGTQKLIQESKAKGHKSIKFIINKRILANEKL